MKDEEVRIMGWREEQSEGELLAFVGWKWGGDVRDLEYFMS